MNKQVLGVLFAVVWLVLGGLGVSAQAQETLDAVLPQGIYYATGPEVLDQETVDALRAVPVWAEATINAANEWATDRGTPWLVTRYEHAINIWLDGGGDAVLVVGNTSNPSLMLVTVGYERHAERMENGYTAWHCERAAIVARRDIEAALGAGR